MPTSIGCGAESVLHDPGQQLCTECTTSEISTGWKAFSPSTPEPPSDQTEKLEKLRTDLAIARERYVAARQIANDEASLNAESPVALQRVLQEYSAATTRYSEALINRTNRILQDDAGPA